MELTTPGVGILSATIWPTYLGAVKDDGSEPISSPDYQRGILFWDVEAGVLLGHGRILVPAGEWTHIIYCHHPSLPTFVASQRLAHPIVLDAPGDIAMERITEADVRPGLTASLAP